jgi:hypothetical protein
VAVFLGSDIADEFVEWAIFIPPRKLKDWNV